MLQAAKTLADFQMAQPPSKFPVLADFEHHQASTTLTPQESIPTTRVARDMSGPSLTTLGLKGGWISLFSSFSQSILLKKACSLMSLSPSRPQPRRFAGCLVISYQRRKHQMITLSAGVEARQTFPRLQCSCSSPENASC